MLVLLTVVGLTCAGVAGAVQRRRQLRAYGLDGLPHRQLIRGGGTPVPIVLCVDLDDTLAASRDPAGRAATERFNEFWLKHYAPRGALLVYNTGRSFDAFMALTKRYGAMLRPNVLVTAEGQEVRWFSGNNALPSKDLGWEQNIIQGWDIAEVRRAVRGYKAANAKMCHPFPEDAATNEPYRESLIVDTRENAQIATDSIIHALKGTGVYAQVFYCGGASYINNMYWVGVVPKNAGKGFALDYILSQLGVKPGHAMVAGDAGNDLTMFSCAGINGTVVANAQPELNEFFSEQVRLGQGHRFHKSALKYADAIVDGLSHFFPPSSLT